MEQIMEEKHEHCLERIVGHLGQLGSKTQPEKQLAERLQPAGMVLPMVVERQFKQPMKRSRPLEEKRYIEE